MMTSKLTFLPRASMMLTLTLFLSLAGRSLVAQERSEDRQRFLRSGTQVSDDPRRTPVAPGPTGPEGSVVLRGGRIFDGTGAEVEQATLVIEGNVIVGVLPPGSTDWPNDSRMIDVSGMTVMPGLIDMHTHLTYTEPDVPLAHATDVADATLRGVERLRFYVESGITSVRDVASLGSVPFRLKEWVRERRIPGPRVFPAGMLITGTGGHAAEGLSPTSPLYGGIREASGPDDWREAVREQFKAGADVIKIASHFSPDEVRAAVEEAHALGLKITCDCETFYVDWAVEAGVDMVEHPLPRSDEAIRSMEQRGVGAVPTLIPYVYIFDLSGGYWGSTSRRFTFSKDDNVAMLRRLREAGVKIGVGTDLVTNWFRFLPASYIRELEMYVEAGYTATDALLAATRVSAELLAMGDKLGTLQVGKLADVLVVEGRPDVNLRDLENVRYVIRDGEVVVEDGHVVIPRHVPVPEPKPGGGREWMPGSN